MRCERLVTKPFKASLDATVNDALTPRFVIFQINAWLKRNTILFEEEVFDARDNNQTGS
jgi:hypothetical protein